MSDATQTATDATTHLGGDPASAPAAPAPAPAATSAPAATPAPSAAPAATPAPSAAPAATPAPSPAPTPAPTAAPKAASGAPESYEAFTLPEGVTVDEASLGKFTEIAKELNLTQEQAQKLVTFNGELQQGTSQQLQAALDAQGEKWSGAAKADKEFGGDAFDANLAVAKQSLEKFGTPELKSLLVDSKLGNHPEVIRFMYRVGQAISQDGFVPGRTSAPADNPARAMYPSMNQ